MEGRSGEVMTVAILFLILTWLTVSLRVYVRAIMLRNLGDDDWAMAVTLVRRTLNMFLVVPTDLLAAVYHIPHLSDCCCGTWDGTAPMGTCG